MFIWWDSLETWWTMSALLGVEGLGFWTSPTTSVVGTYAANGTYTGTPAVAITV